MRAESSLGLAPGRSLVALGRTEKWQVGLVTLGTRSAIGVNSEGRMEGRSWRPTVANRLEKLCHKGSRIWGGVWCK